MLMLSRLLIFRMVHPSSMTPVLACFNNIQIFLIGCNIWGIVMTVQDVPLNVGVTFSKCYMFYAFELLCLFQCLITLNIFINKCATVRKRSNLLVSTASQKGRICFILLCNSFGFLVTKNNWVKDLNIGLLIWLNSMIKLLIKKNRPSSMHYSLVAFLIWYAVTINNQKTAISILIEGS